MATECVRRSASLALALVALVAVATGLSVLVGARPAQAQAEDGGDPSITCQGIANPAAELHRTALRRTADPDDLSYWMRLGRAATRRAEAERAAALAPPAPPVPWTVDLLPDGLAWADPRPSSPPEPATPPPEAPAARWPQVGSPICDTAQRWGLTEVRPGIMAGRTGQTVTVVAERAMVAYRAVDGPRTFADAVDGDIVVNANWFTATGSQAPVVSDGSISGSGDTVERGQIVAYRPGCGDDGGPFPALTHVWTGEIYQHDPCVLTAVSGVSLVHKGVRADAYPGYDITNGYTNTSRSHSFIGFDQTTIVIVATTEMNASALADYAIELGATEGVMLDGGGSTQISTPTVSLTSGRPVTAFAILDSLFDE